MLGLSFLLSILIERGSALSRLRVMHTCSCCAQGRLDIDSQCRGFLELAKEAVGHLVSSIFADHAFMELFHKLYCSEEWLSGSVTASIIATLGDYFDDYEKLIEQSWFKR